MSAGGRVRILRHNRVELALHELVEGEGRPLLLLHGLGECAREWMPPELEWPGPVYALDFTGHGRSSVPRGGGYTAEILVGDADAALESIGVPVSAERAPIIRTNRDTTPATRMRAPAAVCDLAALEGAPRRIGCQIHDSLSATRSRT